MIVLRPSRNRTGSLQDEIFAESQSDRRKVGYMFSTSGVPGLYYRNVDQQVEQMLETQGSLPDPSADAVLLAAEVADLRFQYLDGTTNSWVDQWHSRDMAGLAAGHQDHVAVSPGLDGQLESVKTIRHECFDGSVSNRRAFAALGCALGVVRADL